MVVRDPQHWPPAGRVGDVRAKDERGEGDYPLGHELGSIREFAAGVRTASTSTNSNAFTRTLIRIKLPSLPVAGESMLAVEASRTLAWTGTATPQCDQPDPGSTGAPTDRAELILPGLDGSPERISPKSLCPSLT